MTEHPTVVPLTPQWHLRQHQPLVLDSSEAEKRTFGGVDVRKKVGRPTGPRRVTGEQLVDVVEYLH